MKTILNITLFVMALSGVIALESCGDDDKPKTEIEKLPPATQEGKGTFGCLIDGKAFKIKSSMDVESFYQEGVLSIGASTDDYGIGITIRDVSLSTGVYPLNGTIDSFGELGDIVNSCLYATTDSYTGNITFTHLDQANFIISGTFEFEAYSDDCDKVVKVTHGRFDLHYAP